MCEMTRNSCGTDSFLTGTTKFEKEKGMTKVRVKDGQKWGNWKYNGRILSLEYDKTPSYDIDLEKCTSGSEVLDWIFQVQGKSWMVVEDVGNLVAALAAIFPGAQGLFCPFGNNKELDASSFLLRQRDES